MSLAPAVAGHRAPSPAATGPNFSSNNPFRRAVSPAPPVSNNDNNRARMSNNPFLDPPSKPSTSTQKPSSNPFGEDIFKDLSLLDRPASNGKASPEKKVAPAVPSDNRRPSRPQEDQARRAAGSQRGPPRPRGHQESLDIFATPPQADGRRPRRNSESSIMDKDRIAEDDRRRRERRREREARREREGKSKDTKSRPAKKPQGLDLIDKLDVTGIYGQGLFHHDGPFDACNPHRNRKKDYRAPMQAFPVGSANNAIGGSGPLNKNIDLDKFHGRGEEGFNDYSATGGPDTFVPLNRSKSKRQESFNPTDRVEQVHGEETYGLGTSTFLEGAPASKTALQRRESETENTAMAGSGLGRKKSLAVRLRGLSQPRRNGEFGGERVMSPDARYNPGSPESPAGVAQSAGGPGRLGAGQERNPFFQDYDDAYEKKGAQIRIAEPANKGTARAPNSPRGLGLTRSLTADSAVQPHDEPERGGGGGGGFLSRMKSLKGGRRTRPERRAS
ncbi:hypothetical protein MBLNU459_g3601t1 [Dothideomycetes sp. NU459]